MYLYEEKKNVYPDFEMIERIVEKLNEKFDPHNAYDDDTVDSKMFEFQYKTDSKDREAWRIVFMGTFPVVSGSLFGLDYYDYEGCQDGDYISLESKNELKIQMLAESKAINIIKKIVTLISVSNISKSNKEDIYKIVSKNCHEVEE